MKDELTIPLTKGVKYDFSSNQKADANYRKMLCSYLGNRKDISIHDSVSIDISLLSKELKIEKGEEFAFSILPDTNFPGAATAGSTIILDDKAIDIKSDEKFRIDVPYSTGNGVNIQTDITYLQDNFVSGSYKLNIDTVPFFSEIAIDTNGLYKRRMEEISNTNKSYINSFNKINPSDILYRVQIAAFRKPLSDESIKEIYSGELPVQMIRDDGYCKYYIVEKPTYFEAKIILDECGVKDAFIAAYEDGKRISLKNAILSQYIGRMAEDGITLKDSVINVVMLNFEFNKYTLHPNDEFYLDELIIKELNLHSNYYVVVNGHTDIRGTKAYNYKLGDERAEFIKDLLVQKGIDKKRIKTFSFGKDQLLKACDSPENCDESVHKVNRRVEIVILCPK
jgi:outer membrane protein OmpA-like peptidoglycan-associated protein